MKRPMILLLLLLLMSCAKTEVIGVPMIQAQCDTIAKRKVQAEPIDTTRRESDERVPIGFDASVADWQDHSVNL